MINDQLTNTTRKWYETNYYPEMFEQSYFMPTWHSFYNNNEISDSFENITAFKVREYQ